MEYQRGGRLVEKSVKIASWILSIYALYELSLSAANKVARDVIYERSKGVCEGCGREDLNGSGIVSHINHTKNKHFLDICIPNFMFHVIVYLIENIKLFHIKLPL